MWQSVTIFIKVLGMVHSTNHFVHSPHEILLIYLKVNLSVPWNLR